mgnify:CR=1 FL=1|tara:strand:+ start:745 stop:1596 length:852 start_codon:yes stop_codon:yes gene_type:complete
MPHHDELLNFAEEFLTESPTPGEKRGDYENSKLRKSKMSTQAAKKASSDVLRGVASRGGASVSVANTELKKREDSKSSSKDDDDLSADEKEKKDKFKSDAEKAVDKVEDMIGDGDPDIPPDLPDDMEDPEVRNKFKDFFENNPLGKALSAFFDTEPAPFPGMEDSKAEFLTKAKNAVIAARDKQIEKGSEKRKKEKEKEDKEKERESTFRGMSVDRLEKILDDPDVPKEDKKAAREILKDKKKNKKETTEENYNCLLSTIKEMSEPQAIYKNLHTVVKEITNE